MELTSAIRVLGNAGCRKSECRHLRSLRSVRRRVDVHQDAARIPTMPLRKPRKKKLAFCSACKRQFHRHQHLVFPRILEYILPNSSFLRKTSTVPSPCSGTAPCRNLTILRALWHTCSGMPSSRKEEPWSPFKISRSVSRSRRRNSPNSKRRKGT